MRPLLVDGSSLPIAKLSLIVTAPGTAFTAKLYTATETSAVSFKGSVVTDTVLEQATGTATVTKSGVPYVINFTLPLGGNLSASATRNSIALGSATDGQKLSTVTVLYAGSHTAVLEPATGDSAPAGAGWATAHRHHQHQGYPHTQRQAGRWHRLHRCALPRWTTQPRLSTLGPALPPRPHSVLPRRSVQPHSAPHACQSPLRGRR